MAAAESRAVAAETERAAAEKSLAAAREKAAASAKATVVEQAKAKQSQQVLLFRHTATLPGQGHQRATIAAGALPALLPRSP